MPKDLPDCVIFMLLANDHLLVEKRKMNKLIDPGMVEIPGGHLEPGETRLRALKREMQEELEVLPVTIQYICTLLSHRFQKMHYYAITSWAGEIRNNEAEALFWIPLHDLTALDLQMDKTAVAEYLRLFPASNPENSLANF